MSLFETTSSTSVVSSTAYEMAEPLLTQCMNVYSPFLMCRFLLKRESISIFSQSRLYFLVEVVANISALSNVIGSLSKQDGEDHLKISLRVSAIIFRLFQIATLAKCVTNSPGIKLLRAVWR